MADYISSHSGKNIDKGVQKALELDLDIIGCKKVQSSMGDPLDLNLFMDAGYWVVDYFINGPSNLLDYSPLPFSVAISYNGTDISKITQSVDINFVKAYREYNPSNMRWSEWIQESSPKILKSTGTADNIVIMDSTVSVSDMMKLTIQLNATLNQNAKITINGKGPYPIKMADGNGIVGRVFTVKSFITVIFYKESNTFYLIGTPIPDNLKETLIDYGNRILILETDSLQMQDEINDLDQRVDGNTDAINEIITGGGFAHAVDHSTDGQANKPWTKITFNEEGVVTRGEHSTGEDIKISSSDNTTIADKIEEIEQIVPDGSKLEKDRVLITDNTGKMATSEMTSEQLRKTIIMSETGQNVPALPS